ncbi:MAG: PAS domain-containing protein [Acidobacteria bacterium]|nr:PAS domain-containing protein [Acidobacteriota bacterium]MYD71236.1 PAS domain-containing protein [Acidobacteriota bacterium]MYJ03932.1 PAS domain-containing protein [Acidobacteriota bacterium]
MPPDADRHAAPDPPGVSSLGSTSDALTRLFDAVHTGMYVGLLPLAGTGTTIAANPYLKLMFGFEPETADTDVRPFAPDRFLDLAAHRALVGQLLRDGAVTDHLVRLRRIDERPIWVEVTAHATRTDDETARVEAVLRDVSERRALEDQGRDIYHQLLQAEKLAALGQTVSGVAHELNNPLATILTSAERLAGRQHDDVTRRGLKTILSESERAARIVRNLLDFSRKRHTTRGMVDINEVARETLSLRAYDQRVSNVTTIDALATGLPPVFADAHHLKQVLLNLVINAEQAMLATNGRGTLIARSWHDVDQRLVVLEIHDDGPGIPPDVQEKIFDPFFTTKSPGKGTGLGLTVAQSIVADHGGRMRVESSPGGGASFRVELPTTG